MSPRLALALACACACAPAGPSSRSLHYIGDTLVVSEPVDHRAYASYLQARLALESEPADLPRALAAIERAVRYDRDDAHLWAVRGDIELRLGDVAAARRSSARALALSPEYPLARQLAARLESPVGPRFVDARGAQRNVAR